MIHFRNIVALALCAALLLCFTGCAVLPCNPAQNPIATISPTTPPTETPSISTTPPTTPTETEVPSTDPVFDPNAILDAMSLEEKVGQIFLARCPDVGAVQDISTYHFGGFILFGRDFKDETPNTVQENISKYQAASKIPMLIAVDEEGGDVCRVSSYPQYRDTPFPSPRCLYEAGGLEQVIAVETEKCLLLRSLGIHVNMAPVCDITTDPSSFMYRRSLGESPDVTAEFVSAVVNVMTEYQIGSVLKHFPGYGNNTDTHKGIAVDERSLESLASSDFLPFSAGIQAGCGGILVSHIFVNCLDENLPASLSPAVSTYLRDTLGFSGVIVTDDLSMDAITDLYGPGEAAVLAVLAGNDLLCSTQYQAQYDAVLEAVYSGRIPESRIEEAVLRILQWKYQLGLLE